jgi:hypothetical protein
MTLVLNVLLSVSLFTIGITIGVWALMSFDWLETRVWPYIRCWLAILCGATIAAYGVALMII